MKRVNVDVRDGKASVGTVDFLGDRWDSYQTTCAAAGCRWNRVRGDASRNEGPLDNLPALVRDLASEGFSVDVSPSAREVIERASKTGLSTAEETALERVKAVEARVLGKGLALWRPFQEDGAVFLASRDRALECSAPGTGKTIQALVALPENAAVLVICPKSVLVNWAREARRWRPDLDPVIVLRSVGKRMEDTLGQDGIRVEREIRWPRAGEIVVTTYESMPCAQDVFSRKAIARGDSDKPRVRKSIEGRPWTGTVLISDETHRLKNRDALCTLRWGTLRDVVLAKECGGRVWGLTGTPIFNRPFDLAGVLNAVSCFSDVFVSWKDFMRRMGGSEGMYGVEWSGIIDPTVATSLKRVMIRREKKDVMPYLPAKTRRTVEVEPNARFCKVADRVMDDLEEQDVDWGDEDDTDAEREVLLSKAISKIAFEDMSRIHRELSELAYNASLDMIDDFEAEGEPVVVACWHREQVEALGLREGWKAILGGESIERRQQTIDEFQAGKLKGVAVTISAGGVGITLTRAAHILFLSKSWSPSENEQMEGRLHRGGQERGVVVTDFLVDHPLIRRMQTLLGWKTQMHEDAIGAASLITTLAEERQQAAQEALAAADRDRMAADGVVLSGAQKIDARAVLAGIPAGRYALDSKPDEQGATHTVFWLLDKPEDPSRYAGWAFLKVQKGDEAGRFSTIRPDGMATPAAMSVLEKIAVDPIGAMKRYGIEIGECAICGLTLTSEESRKIGIGPVCLAKVEGKS